MSSSLERVLVVACAVLTLPTASASAATWHYGARAGVNLANVRGDVEDFVAPDWRPGVAAGAFAEADVSPSTSIAIELDYVQKGAQFTEKGTLSMGGVADADADLRLSYLEVPLLARLHLMKGSTFIPFVEAGPTFGFALSATQKTDGSADVDLTNDLKTMDAGLALGVGVRFHTQAGRVDFESRYGTGFGGFWNRSTAVTSPGPSPPGNAESINHGFQFSVALSR